MTANVGGIDRILRIVAGLALIALAVTGVVGAWGYLGVIPLATGVFRFCGAPQKRNTPVAKGMTPK